MGALLAYETCRALCVRGFQRPYLLVASGRSAPHLPLLRAPYWDRPRPEFLEELFKLGGLSREILELPELLDYVEPILRADLAMHDSYQHAQGAPLELPVVALYGSADASFPPAAVLDWKEVCAGPFHEHEFSGGHFFINEHRTAVLEWLAYYGRIFLPKSYQKSNSVG
jgi:medium-chain acyl-[acyl-carrier-protein] hydrolase